MGASAIIGMACACSVGGKEGTSLTERKFTCMGSLLSLHFTAQSVLTDDRPAHLRGPAPAARGSIEGGPRRPIGMGRVTYRSATRALAGGPMYRCWLRPGLRTGIRPRSASTATPRARPSRAGGQGAAASREGGTVTTR
jgi:hypothetical protein